MPYSRPFNHHTDQFSPGIGTAKNPRLVSFWKHKVKSYLDNSSVSYCTINAKVTPGSTQVNFSMQAFNVKNEPIGQPLDGNFPCPANCQPPVPFLGWQFSAEDINVVLDFQPDDKLFDIALAIRSGNANDPVNSYAICSNSYNPSSPASGGGPRRGLGDEIFISL